MEMLQLSSGYGSDDDLLPFSQTHFRFVSVSGS